MEGDVSRDWNGTLLSEGDRVNHMFRSVIVNNKRYDAYVNRAS